MIGSENENELALDNVAGIRKRTQSGTGGGRTAEGRAAGRADQRLGCDIARAPPPWPTLCKGGKGGQGASDCSRRVDRISGGWRPSPPLAHPLQIRTQVPEVRWSLYREAARRHSPGRAFRAIQSVKIGLIVRMQSRAENIFILKTYFAAFCRRMFHIKVER
jgi:hypothetical protein